MIYFRTVDLSFDEFFSPLRPDAIESIMQNLARAAHSQWVKLVNNDSGFGSHLKGDYNREIQPIEYSPGKAILALVGELSHLLEDGDAELDMRTTLLGPNVPIVPEGQRGAHMSLNDTKYRAIPFRHTTPGAGKVVGQAMGSAYSGHQGVLDAVKLGRAVHKAAKKLTDYSIRDSLTENSPQRKNLRLRTKGIRAGLAPGQKAIPLLRAHHKSNIYQGMIRESHTYEKSTQNTYTTFRTISTGTTEGWIRGPIAPRRYLDQVSEYVGRIAPMQIEAFLEAAK